MGPGVAPGQRIYIVIDPNNQIAEVHDDNNVGWYALGDNGSTAIEKGNTNLTWEAKLFPNPASDGWTQLDLRLHEAGKLHVDLLDLQGRLIRTLYNDELSSGNYLLPVSVAGFPQGFYLVRIDLNSQQRVLRIINIK